jgi:hypothetical protein
MKVSLSVLPLIVISDWLTVVPSFGSKISNFGLFGL